MARQRGYDQQVNQGPNRDIDRQRRWQAQRGSTRNHEEFGEPNEWQEPRYGQGYYDEFPDGGRGVYTNDERPSRSSERAQFVETVYGPQRESYLPHRSGYHRMRRDNYGGSNYYGVDYENGDYTRGPTARSGYDEPYAEQQLGYGHNDVVSSNWSRTAGGGEWAADAKSPAQSSHRGKGPKGYERSDERLKELICERLTDAPYLDASDITVEVQNHEVTLTGTVVSRAAKHMAEDLVESVWGISDINNQLKLAATESMQRSSDSSRRD